MRAARPRDDRKCKIRRHLRDPRWFRDLQQTFARNRNGRRYLEPVDPPQQDVQLVAIETAHEVWRVEQRPWPALRCRTDLAQGVAAVLGVGGDDDRHIMIR